MLFPYAIDEKYKTKVAYFSMEFAIHQALKIYSGGLGFLAGSHMRSVYDLKQNVIGVGILWSYGYYDQQRREDRSMEVHFRRKHYSFLEDTGIIVQIVVNKAPILVKAYLLRADTFRSAPIFLLTTDIPENDFLTRTITHKLYDAGEETRIAQEIVLGIGGAKVLEAAGEIPHIYHMNEGHALPMTFYLYNNKYERDINKVKKHVVFTTHTPEKAGNEEHDIDLLDRMGFFGETQKEEAQRITNQPKKRFSLTVGALHMAKITNAVSKIHSDVSNDMWKEHLPAGSTIIAVTNAQNRRFWADKWLLKAYEEGEDYEIVARKKHLKRLLFDEVADQTGKLFDPNILTIVWSRRFVEYKRARLIAHNIERFKYLVTRDEKPVQIIWAGKPHPNDGNSINLFNEIVYLSKSYKRCAILVGYELNLSRRLKQGSDIWLNTPRITREASGTSGMTASMNGSLHLSIPDGWHPEFSIHRRNSFSLPAVDAKLSTEEQDYIDNKNLMDMLEDEIIPLYYDHPGEWTNMIRTCIGDIVPAFDSGRMANEYYGRLYDYEIGA
ncbi:MAG: alpha-glucan family phosphorylase [Helicobacteraceae bacterium]|jgi:starch phosphorylase|nr:alpha-glucan family phosphorylase [Helicobacteraceae bacterium]